MREDDTGQRVFPNVLLEMKSAISAVYLASQEALNTASAHQEGGAQLTGSIFE